MSKGQIQSILFCDIEGTLLDEKGEYLPVFQFLYDIKNSRKPMFVLNSTKSYGEVSAYNLMLLSTNPFIYDNGGGLAISNELVSEFGITGAVQRDDIYSIISIGIPKAELYENLKKIKEANKLDITILEDMSIEEITAYTGKDAKTAQLAKAREFSVPFILNNPDQAGLINSLLNDDAHRCIAGKKFYHYTGVHDKGTGILKLKALLNPAKILSVGDGLIDETMFRVSDEAYLVKGSDDEFATGFSDGIEYEELDGIGPEGLAELLNRVYR